MIDTRTLVRQLYRGVDAFEIPALEEMRVRASRGSPVYGELTPTGTAKMLEYLSLGSKDVLYDLGAGSGKVVVQTALTVPVRKSIGVELSRSRISAARRVVQAAKAKRLIRARACAFRCEDLLTTYLADATVIYTCSTAFSAAFLRRIAKRVAALDRQLRFLTLQELATLPPNFSEEATLLVPTTWERRVSLYVYRVSGRRGTGL